MDKQLFKVFSPFRREVMTLLQPTQIRKMTSSPKESSQKSNLPVAVIHNLIANYLRTINANYTLSVLMRELNIVPEDILTSKQLSALFGLEEKWQSSEGMVTAALELIVSELFELSRRKLNAENCQDVAVQAGQNELSALDFNVSPTEIQMQRLRDQAEDRARQYYETMLNIKITAERQNVESQTDGQLQLLRSRVAELEVALSRAQNATKQARTLQEDSTVPLKQNIEKLLSDNAKLRNATKEAQIKLQKHRCEQSELVKKLQEQLRQERHAISALQRQLQLALQNVTTNVEQLMEQKKTIMQQDAVNPTQKFLQERKVFRADKEEMVDRMSSQVKFLQEKIASMAQLEDAHQKESTGLKELNKRLLDKIKNLDQTVEAMRKVSENNQRNSQNRPVRDAKAVCVGVTEAELDVYQVLQCGDRKEEQDLEEAQLFLQKNHEFQRKTAATLAEMKMLRHKMKLIAEFDQI